MKHITSSDNGIYKAAVKLTKKKYRDETGTYLLEGIKPLKDAVSLGIALERIFADADMYDRLREEHQWLEAEDDITVTVDSRMFGRISGTETSQGIVAVVRKTTADSTSFMDAVGSGNVVVLDRLQDPGNIGTIIRTAEAAGYRGIMVMAGSGDPYGPKVVRAAAGSILRMPVLTCRDVGQAAELLHAKAKKITVTCFEKAVNCFEADLRENIALVIGNEGQGVSREFMDAADIRIKIPMEGSIESLNAAVAAGVIMYQSVGGKF